MTMRRVLLLLAVIATIDVCVASTSVYCRYWTDCSEPCGGFGRRQCPRSNGNVFDIRCHLQSCDEIEDCGKADVVFVLDDSTSIGEKSFWVTKQFAIDIMKGLTIGSDFSRIGMATYSDIGRSQWMLGEYMDEEALEDAIWSVPKLGGNTNTADGLLHAQQILETSGRPSVKHIVVIITDGVANLQSDRTIPRAEEMHDQGIEIFAIGIGASDEAELRGMASKLKADHWHHVPDYTALTLITNSVINQTCKASNANLSICDEWSKWGECRVPAGDCGNGNRSRTRECRFYNYEGATPTSRTDTEYLACDIECAVPTPSPPVYCVNWTDCDAACNTWGRRTCHRSNGKVMSISCGGGSCVPVDCPTTDLVFVIDSSTSIGDMNWWRAKQFTLDVVQDLPIEDEDIRVAAITFADDAFSEWVLGDWRTAGKLQEELWGLDYLRGVTNTQEALSLAKWVFDTSGRQHVKKVVVFLGDGESNVQTHLTIPSAQALHDAGVQVFSIAVRMGGIDELESIASQPTSEHYYEADNYDAILSIVNSIIEMACNAH